MKRKPFFTSVILLPALLLFLFHPADARWSRVESRWGRSSSPRAFTPLSIPGCGLWLDAAVGVDYGTSYLVESWDDRSPRGNDASGFTGATEPLWSASDLSGCPAVRFDGIDDYLTAHSAAALLSGNDTPFTLLAVLAIDPGSTEAGFQGATADAASYIPWKACRRLSGNIRYMAKDYGNTKEVVGTTDYLTTAQVVTFVNNGISCALHQNGTNIGVGDADIAIVILNYFWIGKTFGTSSGHFKGVIAQFLVYDRALSDAQRGRVERYLMRRYGISG